MRPTFIRSSLLSRFKTIFGLQGQHHGFAGYDLQGNRYYERKVEDIDRLKRTVEYNQDDFRHWDVTETTNSLPSQSASVPLQWQAWMRHSRKDPPTIEELQADVARQDTLRQRVQVLEAKDREQQLRQRAAAAATLIPPPTATPPPIAQPSQPPSPKELAPTPESDPLRQESQRALQQEDAKRKADARSSQLGTRGSGPGSVKNPLKSGEGVGKEWKPEGWAPAVGRRRGAGGAGAQ